MGSPVPYVLARSSGLPDELFADLNSLAARLVELCGDDAPRLAVAYVARSRFPAGAAVKVAAGWGGRRFIGYCFLPPLFPPRYLCRRVRGALDELAGRAAA